MIQLDEYVDKENVDSLIENEPDGIYKILVREIYHDKGQEGEGQWEIAPYYCIEKFTITKICGIENHITKEERNFNAKEKRVVKMKKLQDFISGFSNESIKYELCKVWHDKLALRTKTGNIFQMSTIIYEFESDAVTDKNLKAIKDWCINYFNNFEKIAV